MYVIKSKTNTDFYSKQCICACSKHIQHVFDIYITLEPRDIFVAVDLRVVNTPFPDIRRDIRPSMSYSIYLVSDQWKTYVKQVRIFSDPLRKTFFIAINFTLALKLHTPCFSTSFYHTSTHNIWTRSVGVAVHSGLASDKRTIPRGTSILLTRMFCVSKILNNIFIF